MISGFALYYSTQSNNPHIILSGDLPYMIIGEEQQLAVLPIELYNTGKEAVLLQHLLETDYIDTILFVTNGKILSPKAVDYVLYASEYKVDSFKDLKKLRKFELPMYNLKQLIKSNESYKFNIVVAIKSTIPLSPLISFDIQFSNGQVVQIRSKLSNKTLERNS